MLSEAKKVHGPSIFASPSKSHAFIFKNLKVQLKFTTMSQLLSYYKLCPITDEIVGIAEDSQRTSIICTLGKKIVYILRVSFSKI